MANTDTQLLANLTFALKNVYHPRMIKLIFEENFLFQNLKRRTARMGMEGNTMIIPVQTSEVESFRGTTEDGSLARPTVLDGFTAEVPKRTVTSTVQFSHLTDLYTRAQRASYIRAKTSLMDSVARGFNRKLDECFWGYGTGVLARINGAPNAAAGTFVVDAEMNANSGNTWGTKFLRKHMRIQFSANQTGTDLERAADCQVTLVNRTTNTITVKGPLLDAADDDYVFWEGSKNLVPTGIEAAIDDGTIKNVYLGVNRTTTPAWQSQVSSSVGAANLENTILKLANTIRSSTTGGMGGPLGKKSGWVIFTRPGVLQAWFEQMSPDRRYMVEQMTRNAKPTLQGGFDDIYMWTPVTGPIQTVTAVNCSSGRLFLSFWVPNSWYFSEARGMGWYDDGGGALQRVRGTFLQEATWYWPVELVLARPDLQGKLTGITEST